MVRPSSAVVTLLAAATYGVTANAYGRFYSGLNLTPEDVGLSYSGTLIRAFGLVLLLAVLGVILLTVLFWRPRIGGLVGLVVIGIVTVLLVRTLTDAMDKRAICVRNGEEPTNVKFLGFTLLKVEAHRVTLVPLKSGVLPAAPNSLPCSTSGAITTTTTATTEVPKCLIYLGQTGDTASFWDSNTQIVDHRATDNGASGVAVRLPTRDLGAMLSSPLPYPDKNAHSNYPNKKEGCR